MVALGMKLPVFNYIINLFLFYFTYHSQSYIISMSLFWLKSVEKIAVGLKLIGF